MNGFYLGVDGGGTYCKLTLIDSQKNIVAEASGNGVNVHSVGADSAKAHFGAVLTGLLSKAGISANSLTGCCFGGAGLGRDADKTLWAGILRGLGIVCPISLVTDCETALYGGLGQKTGIAVIAGTGSMAGGYDETGRFARAGGWGHILGDEGSGYDIGRLILMSVTKAYDGAGPKTLLTELVLNRLGIETVPELVNIIYGYKDKKDIAALAPLMDTALYRGDYTAMIISASAVHKLLQLVKAVYAKLSFKDDAVMVTTAGGVFESANIYGLFENMLEKEVPAAILVKPMTTQAYGAALIAFGNEFIYTSGIT